MKLSCEQIPCPCESGLNYLDCCGADDRDGLKTIASIASVGINSPDQLPSGLVSALKNIHTCPDLFPLRINLFQDYVQWVKMSPYCYRNSVFLDSARIMGTCAIESNLEWLQEISAQTSWQVTPFIFHTAFCGSTLMSKALDAVFNCLPLREPEILGGLLAYLKSPGNLEAEQNLWLERLLRVLSRRYQPQEVTVVKTNDYVNSLMKILLQSKYTMPILFMYTPLNEFVVSCLKDSNRRRWISERYRFVRDNVQKLLNIPPSFSLHNNSPAEMAALYWSYNISLYQEAWRADCQHLRSLNFNLMLDNPVVSVKKCGTWFNLDLLPDLELAKEIEKVLHVYSKNIAILYNSSKRDQEINNLLKLYQTEVKVANNLAQRILDDQDPDVDLPGNLI